MIGSNLRSRRGFTLLIAIVLSAVAASITVALTTLAYKDLLLSSSALGSQYAFYAADTALECALYWDNGTHNSFPYTTSYGSSSVNCANVPVTLTSSAYNANTTQYQSAWFTVPGGCARISIYKGSSSVPGTKLFGDGVNTTAACSAIGTAGFNDPRAIERGLKAYY